MWHLSTGIVLTGGTTLNSFAIFPISMSRLFEPVRKVKRVRNQQIRVRVGSCRRGVAAADPDGAGGVGDDVVVFDWLVRSWLPSRSRKGWGRREVAGALPGEPDGV